MKELEERRVEIPPFSFWEWHGGEGSDVVLLHGLSGSSRWWARNVEALTAHHRVTAIDLVGFGRNRGLFATPLPLSFDDVTTLLARRLSLFEGPVHLVGHSMGGHIAIHLAAAHPHLVRSLTLIGSTGIPIEIDPWSHLRSLAFPTAAVISFARVLLVDFLRAGPTSVAIAATRLLRNDARDSMRALRVPTLLVWGESDPLVPLKYARQMEGEIKGSRLVVLEKAGHIPMWENAGRFNRELLDFLAWCEEQVFSTEPPRLFGWGIQCEGPVCYREAGREREVVLVHGLGMSSGYFERLAERLFEAGVDVIAPDLPGFGESRDAPPMGPAESAAALGDWARSMQIERAAWLGHSTGAQIVAHLRATQLSLVRSAIYVSPVWTSRRHRYARLVAAMLLDGLRETPRLLGYVVRAYWGCGLMRWFATMRRFVADATSLPEVTENDVILFGERDPLVDEGALRQLGGRNLRIIGGAHATIDSHPEAVAAAVVERLGVG